VQSALELRRVRRDGSILYVHLWNAPLLGANGEPIGNMGILADITAHKRAEEALQEANSRLRTLVTASPLAILALDLQGRIISWNPAAERMFGWRQEEVLGRPLPTIPPGQEQAFQAQHQRTLQGIPCWVWNCAGSGGTVPPSTSACPPRPSMMAPAS